MGTDHESLEATSVEMGNAEVQGKPKDFDNLRMFIRADDGQWKLIAWANEAI